jgi:hypothetical protein
MNNNHNIDKQVEKIERLEDKVKSALNYKFKDSDNEENAGEIRREIQESLEAYIELMVDDNEYEGESSEEVSED